MYEYERNSLHALIMIIPFQYYTSYPDVKIYFHEVCLDSVDHTIFKVLEAFVSVHCLPMSGSS